MRTATQKAERGSAAPGSLAARLWPKARRSVLGLLYFGPDDEWHLREIARRTALAPSTVQREVVSLVKAGILERRAEPGRAYYRANRRCPIFPELRQIALKTVGLVEVLREALRRTKGIRVALVYGSLARGEGRADSGVDLLVVGDTTIGKLSAHLHSAERFLGREVNPTVYPVAEFREKMAARHHFLTEVMDSPKLFVIGDQDVLAGLAG